MPAWLAWVPARAWAALGGAIALGLGVWWHQQHAAAVLREALDSQLKDLQAQAHTELLRSQVEAHRVRAKADVANFEIVYDIQTQRDGARRDLARAGDLQRGLLGTIAALRRSEGGSADGAGTRSLADAAPQLADALGECGGRYVEVAAVADHLTIQVIGLQRFITEVVGPVCIAGQTVDLVAASE